MVPPGFEVFPLPAGPRRRRSIIFNRDPPVLAASTTRVEVLEPLATTLPDPGGPTNLRSVNQWSIPMSSTKCVALIPAMPNGLKVVARAWRAGALSPGDDAAAQAAPKVGVLTPGPPRPLGGENRASAFQETRTLLAPVALADVLAESAAGERVRLGGTTGGGEPGSSLNIFCRARTPPLRSAQPPPSAARPCRAAKAFCRHSTKETPFRPQPTRALPLGSRFRGSPGVRGGSSGLNKLLLESFPSTTGAPAACPLGENQREHKRVECPLAGNMQSRS